MRALPEWHFRLEHLNDVVHSARGVDVSAWHLVDVPHDFAIEDLPPSRGPEVLAMRNSSGWRFKAGDNPRWSLPEHGDRRWRQVPVPADCRTYGTTLSSGFMWFRHRFVASTEQIRLDAAGKLRLALGAIADADETFVNGVRIGKTGLFPQDEPRLQPWEPRIRPRSAAVCSDALQYRTYQLPAGSLRGNEEVLAVRVFADQDGVSDRPCGLVDPPAGNDRRAGPFDPAVSEGGLASGFTATGIGWYRTTLPLSISEREQIIAGTLRLLLHFDGVYGRVDVWVDGTQLTAAEAHPLASMAPFQVEVSPASLSFVTPSLSRTAPPVELAVRVDGRGVSSRWYSGLGILREVHLYLLPSLHLLPVALGGLQVRTLGLTGVRRQGRRAHCARVTVTALLHNTGAHNQSALLSVYIASHGSATEHGAKQGAARMTVHQVRRIAVAPGRRAGFKTSFDIKHAALWMPDSPSLYRVGAELQLESTSEGVRSKDEGGDAQGGGGKDGGNSWGAKGGKAGGEGSGKGGDEDGGWDAVSSRAVLHTGFRLLGFSNSSGFSINGVPLKWRGGNVHGRLMHSTRRRDLSPSSPLPCYRPSPIPPTRHHPSPR